MLCAGVFATELTAHRGCLAGREVGRVLHMRDDFGGVEWVREAAHLEFAGPCGFAFDRIETVAVLEGDPATLRIDFSATAEGRRRRPMALRFGSPEYCLDLCTALSLMAEHHTVLHGIDGRLRIERPGLAHRLGLDRAMGLVLGDRAHPAHRRKLCIENGTEVEVRFAASIAADAPLPGFVDGTYVRGTVVARDPGGALYTVVVSDGPHAMDAVPGDEGDARAHAGVSLLGVQKAYLLVNYSDQYRGRRPWLVLAWTAVQVLVFLYFALNNDDALAVLWWRAETPYPHCEDVRWQAWRLVSYQVRRAPRSPTGRRPCRGLGEAGSAGETRATGRARLRPPAVARARPVARVSPALPASPSPRHVREAAAPSPLR